MELLPAHQQPVHVEVESILVEFGKLRFENMGSSSSRTDYLSTRYGLKKKNSKVRETNTEYSRLRIQYHRLASLNHGPEPHKE